MDTSEKAAFDALVAPLINAAAPYTDLNDNCVVGSERALHVFLDILRDWTEVERCFCDGKSYADAVDILRKGNADNFDRVVDVCRTHFGLKQSSAIVSEIIGAIADALREENNDLSTEPESIVSGAPSLLQATPCLSEIGSMGGPLYASVSLKARKLLLQETLPSIELRKVQIQRGALDLCESIKTQVGSIPESVLTIVDESVPMADVLFPLLNTASSNDEELALAELYLRKLYKSQTLKNFERNTEDKLLKFTFVAKGSERVFSASTPVTSMTDLSSAIKRSGSLQEISSDSQATHVPSKTSRVTVCKIASSVDDIESASCLDSVLPSFPQYQGLEQNCAAGPINILYIIVKDDKIKRTQDAMDVLSKKLENVLQTCCEDLKKADIRRVSYVFDTCQEGDTEVFTLPSILTFRAKSSFKEDILFRNIEPGHAYLLDLARLSSNFSVKLLDSHQTQTANVHLYKATPRPQALAVDKKANPKSRIYVRGLGFISEFTVTCFEKMLVDALNALDIAVHENSASSDNHLFLNLVSDHEKIVMDPATVESTVVTILKRHGDRIASLGLSEVETKLIASLSSDSPPIALRMVASNPTGYVQVMNTYVEAIDPASTTPVFKLIGGTKASLSSSGDSSWEGMKINFPYPLTRPFDTQRKAALRSSDTLYCYDIPSLFEAAVENQWMQAAAGSPPSMVMYTSELVVENKYNSTEPWTMQDYLAGNLHLVQTQRRAGSNNVGMVAWLMTINTVEYPEGRQVVLIANDITFKAGSFGTREDVVFKLASEFARENRLPRLYVAANSGARIGLAESVKKMFKVAFKDPSKPENGFDYLYVSKSDYETHFRGTNQIIVEPCILGGEEIYKITDIIGAEPDLGVENLKGSGLIAGETSAAYKDIFTMTIVLGRTVGIGAYLVRLGQRTIQKTTSSPIILTGYQALNKLMGVDVYSTNDQLGGPSIMYSNGVSHLTSPDHLHAIESSLQWLSYVPKVRGGLLPILDVAGTDDIEREVGFTPSPGTPYDPRFLMTGTENDDGNWLSGFFDKDSFVETLSGWAKSVVVGRARLGGIPMGVIATENRTAEAIKPADPADVQAIEAIKQEAGCVWFPNSAYKTAQAINDFNTEDLPLMIFANWRGFSGGQRDMFDEVLKYGSLIVDGFVSYEQPVFVFIPPHAEIRGGAWVVLDASINSSVMEMYATGGSARGGVLEANGAASVKYREKDLLKTMRRLDSKLVALYQELEKSDAESKSAIQSEIVKREKSLLPVYAQIAVQFCELHDTPGRMKAVGVIHKDVEWKSSRSYFYWRLRRKLAEFDLRKKLISTGNVGRGIKSMTPLEASAMIKEWFLSSDSTTTECWNNDKKVIQWMGENHEWLQNKIMKLTRQHVADEVFTALSSGATTSQVGTAGIVDGISRALTVMSPEQKEAMKKSLIDAFGI